MQTLQTLVRNLVVILLLATFLEMLLPSKSMRGFVQMVMGLFVISAVLSPITTFLHTPLEMEIPAWSVTNTKPQDIPALATDVQGQKIARDAVQEQYRQILINQIKALALSSEGVEGAEVNVEFEEGSGGLTDQPKIALVKVTLISSDIVIPTIQPIIIGQSPPPTQQQSPKADKARDRIADIMSISKDKITVQDG